MAVFKESISTTGDLPRGSNVVPFSGFRPDTKNDWFYQFCLLPHKHAKHKKATKQTPTYRKLLFAACTIQDQSSSTKQGQHMLFKLPSDVSAVMPPSQACVDQPLLGSSSWCRQLMYTSGFDTLPSNMVLSHLDAEHCRVQHCVKTQLRFHIMFDIGQMMQLRHHVVERQGTVSTVLRSPDIVCEERLELCNGLSCLHVGQVHTVGLKDDAHEVVHAWFVCAGCFNMSGSSRMQT